MLSKHRELALEMTRREITDRYTGQVFGWLWAIGHPLFMMGLYVFVFAFVFRTRITTGSTGGADYAAYLLAGLVPWMAFQDAMSKSCNAIIGNASLVKQVVFPVEILAVKGVLASLLPQVVSTLILLLFVAAYDGVMRLTWLLIVPLMIVQTFAMLGVTFLLAAVSVYFRDLKDFVQLFGMAGGYLTPIFYLAEWVPGLFKPLLYLNPFSYMVWCYQDAIYYGRFEHPWAWLVFFGLSSAIFITGFRVFRGLKTWFGNVL